MTYDTATQSARATAARVRLENFFKAGANEQARLLDQVASMLIMDKLMPAAQINIESASHIPRLFLVDTNGKRTATYKIGNHALGQMCGVIGLPRQYARRLREGQEWEQRLFEHNMNNLFHQGKYLDRRKQPTKFLMRFVGDELRGFLSRSFNRHLWSLPLLRGFVGACERVGAKPISATTSSVSFSLKSFLPYVFEPVEGEFVAFGATWSNSDFGSGRMKVSLCVMRVSGTMGTTSVLEDSLSRVHIGSIIQESDLEISDLTAQKEVEAQVSAINDTVSQQLAHEPVNRLCAVIAAAHEEKVPWSRIKAELGRLLQKQELEDVKRMLESGQNDIIDLPPIGMTSGGVPIATRWWASNVVGWMAEREANPDRKNDLQSLAGDLLKAG